MILRRLALLSILLSVLYLWADSASAQTLRYTILGNGTVAGSEVDTYRPDGNVDCTFEFNDRGRGPKIAAHYVVRADGLPSGTDITGNDYLKAPVDEHFFIENGIAHWKSTSENGRASAPGFYISNNGPPAEMAFLVAALLKAKGAPVRQDWNGWQTWQSKIKGENCT
jgi:hypothetical protein